MFYTPIERQISGVHALPRPRPAVMRKLVFTASRIGGPIDHQPELRHPLLDGTLLLPEAGLLLVGTSCHRPLGFAEGRELGHFTGLDVVLLRVDAYHLSFDIYVQRERTWLTKYLRWQREGDSWFVPAGGQGPFVRATRNGLVIGHVAPFLDEADRCAGLADEIAFARIWGTR